MESAVHRIQSGREVVDWKPDFPGRSHEASSTDISAITFRGQLQELQQVEPLLVGAVIIIELGRRKQAEVFVAPRQSAHIRSQFVHLVLKLSVVVVGCVRREVRPAVLHL